VKEIPLNPSERVKNDFFSQNSQWGTMELNRTEWDNSNHGWTPAFAKLRRGKPIDTDME
jgi:hypothetical protein